MLEKQSYDFSDTAPTTSKSKCILTSGSDYIQVDHISDERPKSVYFSGGTYKYGTGSCSLQAWYKDGHTGTLMTAATTTPNSSVWKGSAEYHFTADEWESIDMIRLNLSISGSADESVTGTIVMYGKEWVN